MYARHKKVDYNRVLGMFLMVAMVCVVIVFATISKATALQAVTAPETDACTEVITVVDQAAWTEEINHPEVTTTIHHDAVTEIVPSIWANWSPNNKKGPQNYTPIWPTDERGTWQVHYQGIPGGHEGPDGVYQQGSGNSPWFYRHAEKVNVVTEAYDEVVVVKQAWTEVVNHDEVSHQETVEVLCPVDEEPPMVDDCPEGTTMSAGGSCVWTGPDPVDEPDEPVVIIDPIRPTVNTACVGGALVTKTTDAKGNKMTSTENGHPSCAQTTPDGEPFQEEGM